MNYFRILGYCPEHDFCFIVDSNAMFEQLWQFSSFLVLKNLKVLEVKKLEDLPETNIPKATEDKNHIILRAIANGKPEETTYNLDGKICKAYKVRDKVYALNQ